MPNGIFITKFEDLFSSIFALKGHFIKKIKRQLLPGRLSGWSETNEVLTEPGRSTNLGLVLHSSTMHCLDYYAT